jgi:hypothetical protein
LYLNEEDFMQFVKIATAAALAMGVTTFAVAQERVSPNDQLNRPAPSAQPGDHNNLPSSSSPSATSPRSMDMNSGASGGDSRASGGSAQSAQITEKNVTPMLQAQGYTDVKGVKQSGNTITANAKRDGQSVKLKIDAKTGKVNESKS